MDNSPVVILHGQTLLDSIATVKPKEALVEGLFYKKSSHLMFAPDGIGKSQLCLQMMMEGTLTGNYVFGSFLVPQGFKILYIQTERHPDENLERMKRMNEGIKFDANNFVLDVGIQGKDIKREGAVDEIIDYLSSILRLSITKPDLIVVDPIYAIVGGKINDDEAASHISRFAICLEKAFDCSSLFIHHANRGIRDKKGERIGEDLAGSRFLSAHFNNILSIQRRDKGTILTVAKSSDQNIENNIELYYDSESGLSFVSDDQTQVSKSDRLLMYLRNQKKLQKSFDFDDMLKVSLLSTAGLYKAISRDLKDKLLVVAKNNKGKKLYQFIG